MLRVFLLSVAWMLVSATGCADKPSQPSQLGASTPDDGKPGADAADATTPPQPSGADAAVATDGSAGDTLRDVLLVGNSVSGTISFIDGRTFKNLGSVDVIPDLKARLAEINGSVGTSLAYAAIKKRQVVKHFEPANGDRFVDDVFVSPDGNTLYVSRSNLGDVAAFDLSKAAHPLLWRTHVEGYKADHATLSPDGTRLIVSATSVDKANVMDAKTGAIVGSFATGHYPHQNDYSANGLHIYNGSIGDVSLPFAQAALKGTRQLTVVDAKTFAVVKTYAFSAGIRPSVITPDEKIMYAQLSYLNGVIKYDLTTSTIAKTLDQPLSTFATTNYPTKDDYPHDSAHHGLAMSLDGARLCDAGTIDNSVSIVATATMTVEKTLDVGMIPYWATTSVDGSRCFVSLSGDNAITVIDYAAATEVVRVPVGKFPQRSRLGRVRETSLASLAPAAG